MSFQYLRLAAFSFGRKQAPLLRHWRQRLHMAAAFEFRNASWLADDVYARLKAKNLALCIADTADATTPLVPTADYGYFRLRDEGYGESDIGEWAETITQHAGDWKDVFVYFKHEQEGKGAEFAQLPAKMISRVDLPSAGPPS